jgi:CYTH domain-containing protein
MAVTRRFLIAPSLTRLLRREYGSERVTEGHFSPQSERQAHVRIDSSGSYLVLTSPEPSGDEDKTTVPSVHAEALLEVCPGTLVFERTVLRLNGREVLIDRFVQPGSLDFAAVEFSSQSDADGFMPPVWFGNEVTTDETYANRSIALSGMPAASDTPLSNTALEAVLDLIEGQTTSAPAEQGEDDREDDVEEDNTFDMLRRLAVVPPANTAKPAELEAPRSEDRTAEVAELKPRRPVLPVRADREEDSDERLAVVIEGLSEALSQAAPQKEGQAAPELRAQPGWRWSSH